MISGNSFSRHLNGPGGSRTKEGLRSLNLQATLILAGR
jgi:hypothetical protein